MFAYGSTPYIRYSSAPMRRGDSLISERSVKVGTSTIIGLLNAIIVFSAFLEGDVSWLSTMDIQP